MGEAQRASGLQLAVCIALGALLLPAPRLPNRTDLTHPLNAPGWSLLQEYLANAAYALVGPQLSRRGLQILVALAAAVLAATAVGRWTLHGGWDWNTWWMAPVRVTFPFFAGLLLYRQGLRLRLPGAYAWLSVGLVVLFAAPASRLNGLYEAGCVIVIFPLMVAAGAGTSSAGRLSWLCRFAGQVSYPIYLVHFPFAQVFGHWVAAAHPAGQQMIAVAAALVVFFIGLAWVALRYYDEPMRAWLSARTRQALVRVHPI